MTTLTTITSTGEHAEVDAQTVAVLVEEAVSAGITSTDLATVVFDCCDQTGYLRITGDTRLLEMDDHEAACDIAYGEPGSIGTEISRANVEAQVAFLVAELGESVARFRIQELFLAAAA